MKRSPLRRKRQLSTFGKQGADMKGGKPSGISGVKVMRDGREVCNQFTTTGRREYRRRTEEARMRQGQRCCLEVHAPMCPGYLSAEDATLEHEHGRGMGGGKRDDRIVLPDGRWQNGAAHLCCNQWKGSRFIDYNGPRNALLSVATGV